MRKILALVSFLVVAAACTREPSTNRGTNANANSTGATKPTATMSEAEVTAREKAVWEALEKKDYDAFGNMLASDYLEVEDDGIYDKAGIVTYLKDLNISNASFSDWKMFPLGKDAALITYNVNLKANFKGQAVPPGPYRAASVWANRDGKWLGVYYQETLPETMRPSPAPKGTPAVKSSVSPAAKTPEATTGPDPIANEKLVWDALKSKNYDAFAALLAPDSIEIEASGVYDRAGSVKGVSAFDFSKSELSNWRTVKINNDAALVTYLVKMPGAKPEQERHSTIWLNRGGKWMAFFHQGTPVALSIAAKPEAKK